MAPVYKLTYFDFMGLGEPIRYMLSHGGVNYENVMINRKTNWPAIKPTVPFGHLPILEVDGKVLFQSLAICRYLAKKFNLLTGDDWTNAQMDAMAEAIYDLSQMVTEWHREIDTTKKTLLRKTLEAEYYPVYFTRMNKFVESNGGYFGGKLTWVDLWFVGIMESVHGMWGVNLIEGKYPHLYQLVQKVYSLPSIKSYMGKRPHFDW